ncbi:long-chain fatty acid--CoA ligase [Labilibacter sediminis]|nr:long-chain fatty acid--CoA ligase [Labilibacter sediminis]
MESLVSFFEKQTNKFSDNPILWEKENNQYKSISYKECYNLVQQLTIGLHSFGLKPKDKVALLSEGQNLWLISELAVFSNRAITVPLSTKLEADNDLVFRLKHSESRFILVSQNQLPKIRKIKNELPLLEKIIVFKPSEELKDNEIDIAAFFTDGIDKLKVDNNFYSSLCNKVQPTDIATITYTSGTTAQPKGIMLSQRNYTANVEQAFSYINIPSYYKTLVVLPWDHAFAHTAALYSFMLKGASVASVQPGKTTVETLKNFSNNIKEIQPHILMSVPAMAKNFKKNIENTIAQQGKLIYSIFKFALKTSYWYNDNGANKGKNIKILAKPLLLLFDRIVFSKIKQGFGGNLQFFIGGGALLDYDLQQFFYAINIPMYQGYGLSEASPIISANTPQHHKLGSSGKVVDNLEIKICDDNKLALGRNQLGEIVIKGENVMKGYWKNEEATAETIQNNWLYTGDLGYLDEENFLYVKGRFKSLLIGSDGEKYSPEGIEEAIIDHCDLIDQIMLYNNQNAYTIAIIILNSESIKQFKGDINLIISEVIKQLAQFKTDSKLSTLFPQRWLPSTFSIGFEPFSEKNKLINSTMKMVRDKITSFFQKEIDYCYSPKGKNPMNDLNKANVNKFIHQL